MTPQELRARTGAFAVAIVRFCRPLLRDVDTHDAGRQLMRAGMSVGSNYRAAQRGRSFREFHAKIGVALEESDECVGWLELMINSDLVPEGVAQPLLREAQELTAIFTKSQATMNAKRAGAKVEKSAPQARL